MNRTSLFTSLLVCTSAASFPFSLLHVSEEPKANQVYYLSEPDDTGTSTIDSGAGLSAFSADNVIQIIPSCLSINESQYFPNKVFSSRYFRHMKRNYPKNVDGICGYTAMSMLLSYYDTYWNDDFIPNNYQTGAYCTLSSLDDIQGDYSSPGVDDTFISLQDYLAGEDEKINYMPSYDFYRWKEQSILDYIQANIDSGSFLGKLFSTAQECGYYHQHTNANDFTLSINVNYDIEKNILSRYIVDNSHLAGNVTLQTNQCILNFCPHIHTLE